MDGDTEVTIDLVADFLSKLNPWLMQDGGVGGVFCPFLFYWVVYFFGSGDRSFMYPVLRAPSLGNRPNCFKQIIFSHVVVLCNTIYSGSSLESNHTQITPPQSYIKESLIDSI